MIPLSVILFPLPKIWWLFYAVGFPRQCSEVVVVMVTFCYLPSYAVVNPHAWHLSYVLEISGEAVCPRLHRMVKCLQSCYRVQYFPK